MKHIVYVVKTMNHFIQKAQICKNKCLSAADVDSLLKKSESQHDSPEDGCPFGPLTQRLLQALVEVSMNEMSE